jgi:hypothetical protein
MLAKGKNSPVSAPEKVLGRDFDVEEFDKKTFRGG